MSIKRRIAFGLLALAGGVALIVVAAWQLFAEGVRADATGTAGVIPPLAIVLGGVGIVGFIAGFRILLGAAIDWPKSHDR